MINQNARTVLEKRYLARDVEGNVVETVEGLFERVSSTIAAADQIYDKNANVKATSKKFYELLTSLDFLPNSPTLMNAGRPLGQLSACFVLPINDSMEDIFEAVKQAALIHKSGGGTGFSFSRLRGNGSVVNTTGGVASGPISFMRVFNMATEAVKQGGTRRGANMGILRIDHPDILEFIDCKRNNADITNFNISVGITEAFMNAAIEGKEYDLIDPRTKEIVKRLNAAEVFDKIVDAAWSNGEPGIIFLDRLNRDNVVPSQGEIESTNPCGEQPLLPYESCNLGSINLLNMLKKKDDGYEIDWKKLEKTTKEAVHFLDNVIDVNKYPLEKIDFQTKQTRKVGLGVMGWSDMLLRLMIAYNSDEAIALGEKVMQFITDIGRSESIELAKMRGGFPLFEESTWAKGEKIRNATVTTIAPTGTLSIIAGCSSGVEPIFGYVFIRNVMDGTEMIEVNPILKEMLIERGLYSEELMKKISEQGSVAHIEELPEDIRKIFVCAHDISPEYHIRMQAAFQKYTDNAVSKTVNFCNSAMREDVKNVYLLAYHLDCKGVTIYRDGSRYSQVLNIGKVNKEGEAQEAVAEQAEVVVAEVKPVEIHPNGFPKGLMPRPRPDITTGFTEKVRIGCGNLFITVNCDEDGICEVFTNTGKAGGCPSQSEATSRLLSVALRSGMDIHELLQQLRGIRCSSTIRQQGMSAVSCPDAIARVIEKVYKHRFGDGAMNPQPKKAIKNAKDESLAFNIRFCPECGQSVEHEGGCVICRNCGYSKCG